MIYIYRDLRFVPALSSKAGLLLFFFDFLVLFRADFFFLEGLLIVNFSSLEFQICFVFAGTDERVPDFESYLFSCHDFSLCAESRIVRDSWFLIL